MPSVTFVERYPRPVAEVFALFRRPAAVVALAPEGSGIELAEGPEVVSAGDRFTVVVRRFGLSRRVVTEVSELTEPSRIVETQTDGPFRAWSVLREFRETEGGTELTETVTFEPPGGLLGLTLTADVIERELRHAYAGREARAAWR